MQTLRATRAEQTDLPRHGLGRRQDGRPLRDDAVELAFGLGDLRHVRRLVADLARAAGLTRRRTDELTVVVNELAANSVDHGGGRGTVRGWLEVDALVVEVADASTLGHSPARESPGVTPPAADSERGRGLWIARQLADEIDFRPAGDGSGGTVVRATTYL